MFRYKNRTLPSHIGFTWMIMTVSIVRTWEVRGVQLTGGQRLRVLREALGYTMRDVEMGSQQVSRRLGNDEFAIPPSRLSDIETKGVIPSIFRLYTLAALYRCDHREMLSWFGGDLNGIPADLAATRPNR